MPVFASDLDALAGARFRGGLTLDEVADPETPAADQVILYQVDGRVHSKDSADVETSYASVAELAARSVIVAAFTHSGELAVGAGTYTYYNDTGRTLQIVSVRASVGVAPTGAAVIVDVHLNGTTIYTTQANRPTIAVSTKTVKSTNPNVTAWPDGQAVTVDIDQIGSTIKGAGLVVQITAR
jgi:hypothetical protein